MASFLMLAHFTDQGINNIKESPNRLKQFKDICKKEGAELSSYHMLLGKYDIACLIEAPNPQVIAKIALILGTRGNIRTETMPAFNANELADIINKL
ncbi:MAG: GYD domain-containing protein [Candidatus Berkiella sp.]